MGQVSARTKVVVQNPQGSGFPPFQMEVQLDPGCEVYQVSLQKPLGLTLTGLLSLNQTHRVVTAEQQQGDTCRTVCCGVACHTCVGMSAERWCHIMGPAMPSTPIQFLLASTSCMQ